MFAKLGRIVMNTVRSSNKETVNIRKFQTEVKDLKNTIIEMKNILEGFNSTLNEAKDWIIELENKATELIQRKQEKKNN